MASVILIALIFGISIRIINVSSLNFQEELNVSTFSWGMEITEVELSDIKIIKEAEQPGAGLIKMLSQPQVAGQLFQQFTKMVGNQFLGPQPMPNLGGHA